MGQDIIDRYLTQPLWVVDAFPMSEPQTATSVVTREGCSLVARFVEKLPLPVYQDPKQLLWIAIVSFSREIALDSEPLRYTGQTIHSRFATSSSLKANNQQPTFRPQTASKHRERPRRSRDHANHKKNT